MRKIQICRLLAGVLALVLILGMVPMAFAAGEESAQTCLTHTFVIFL